MNGNDLYCDSVISVLIIVEYYLSLICVMLAVVMNRGRFLFFFRDVATRRERFQRFMVSEFAHAYSRSATCTITKGAMFILCQNGIYPIT